MADDPTERAKRYRQKAEEITREAQRSTLARSEFLHVDHGPIRNASSSLKPGTAFALQFIRCPRLAPQQRVRSQQRGAAGCNQSI